MFMTKRQEYIGEYLQSKGLSRKLSGYVYLQEALEVIFEDEQVLYQEHKMQIIVGRVADKHNTMPSAINRCMDYAVSLQSDGLVGFLVKGYLYVRSKEEEKPTLDSLIFDKLLEKGVKLNSRGFFYAHDILKLMCESGKLSYNLKNLTQDLQKKYDVSYAALSLTLTRSIDLGDKTLSHWLYVTMDELNNIKY